MNYERLSCGSYLVRGCVFPDLPSAKRFYSWQPGSGLLGPDHQAALAALVDSRLDEIRDSRCDSPASLLDFEKSVDAIRRDLWRRLEFFERHCREVRAANGLSEFNWATESVASVVDAFRDRRGRPSVPASPDVVASYREQRLAKEQFDIAERLWPGFPALPLRPGVCDPLAVDVVRVACSRSSRTRFDFENWKRELDERWPYKVETDE